MIKLIQFLLTGCWHRWKMYGSGKYLYGDHGEGTYYILCCEKCGELKQRVLR